MKPMKSLIICYHRINNSKDSYLRPTKVSDFERQMRYISELFNPVPLEQVMMHFRNKTPLRPRSIAVTFDDGYCDNYENAFPILKRYGIPATIFLTTSYIGNGEIPRWDKGHYDDEKTLMLSWKQVREMNDNGISFGSHTLTHPFLTRISQHQAEEEIRLSKEIIEQQTARPVTSLAYPSGDFSPEIEAIAEESGYLSAVTTLPGYNNTGDDVYALKRNIIQLKSVCHKLFPFSFLGEITGVVDHLRTKYHHIRKALNIR